MTNMTACLGQRLPLCRCLWWQPDRQNVALRGWPQTHRMHIKTRICAAKCWQLLWSYLNSDNQELSKWAGQIRRDGVSGITVTSVVETSAEMKLIVKKSTKPLTKLEFNKTEIFTVVLWSYCTWRSGPNRIFWYIRVNFLWCTKVYMPPVQDWEKLTLVYRYPIGTKDLFLLYLFYCYRSFN